MNGEATEEVIITHKVGLHARPSVKFTKLAKTFPCVIEIATSPDGPWIDAKSIVKVMAARAPEGTRLLMRANGETSLEALAALKGLVERDFDEAHSDASLG
ncbi:HPr family phosphocarrier protein [Hoeflea sp. CAU 1731]